MKQLWSVMRFEFLAFANSKTFVGVTIFLMIISLLGPAAPAIVNTVSNITAERTIAVVDNTGWFSAETISGFISPRATFFGNVDAALHAVEDGNYNYALEITDSGFVLHVTAMGLGVANIQGQTSNMLRYRHRVDNLAEFGIVQATVDEILNFEPHGEVLTIGDVAATADVFFENFIYAYVMVIVLYMGLLLGGAHLLTTVVREKSTKTMELLVTSCPASKMLNGKVLGVGAAVMSQILLMVVSVLVGLRVTPLFIGDMENVFTVAIRPELLAYLVIFFLLGFVMYSYIYAALASTTSRQEDATSMGQLPQLLIMAAFFASIFGMQNPGAEWVTILSHIPLFGPFVMFVRICMGTAATWEIFVSIAAQVVTIGVISWMGTKIYRMGTLMYGAKPTMKNLLEAFK